MPESFPNYDEYKATEGYPRKKKRNQDDCPYDTERERDER